MIQGDVLLAAQALGRQQKGFLFTWNHVLSDGEETSRSGKYLLWNTAGICWSYSSGCWVLPKHLFCQEHVGIGMGKQRIYCLPKKIKILN